MTNQLILNGEAMNASQEGLLEAESFLSENYLFRRNVLNGKIEFATKEEGEEEPQFRTLTQQALNSIVLRAKGKKGAAERCDARDGATHR